MDDRHVLNLPLFGGAAHDPAQPKQRQTWAGHDTGVFCGVARDVGDVDWFWRGVVRCTGRQAI